MFATNFTVTNYTLDKLLFEGGFGYIYEGQNSTSGEPVVIKIEKHESLEHEALVYSHLDNNPRFAKLLIHQTKPCEALVLERLGPSLSGLLSTHKKFSLKSTIQLGLQMLDAIKQLHSHGILHSDIKPSNFVMDLGLTSVKLIDFGLSEFYLVSGVHRKPGVADTVIGTKQYSSRYVQRGQISSRRDDLESWFYCLLKFIRGNLPWSPLKKNREILHLKTILTAKRLTNGLLAQFYNILIYIKNLSFKEEPNYQLLSNLLMSAAADNSITLDHQFDWG